MKRVSLKLLLLALYLFVAVNAWLSPVLTNNIVGIVIKGFLIYCGIIVAAHLVAEFKRGLCWLIDYEKRAYQEHQQVASVDFEVETEAT